MGKTSEVWNVKHNLEREWRDKKIEMDARAARPTKEITGCGAFPSAME